MFDSLLSGKFSKKCKHCIKCINSRLLLIKKKKQATVKFLKKDVADLLANGHDSNAFGRIEAILVEVNRVYCYEMIENYCQCILNLLPSLQKLRECPEDAKEAISTLIFAAARFSDLPELYDLRQIFTERYGGQMESSVNAQFIEKVQKKPFSTDTKLQLMKSIADEFSVRWDPNAFQQKLANPTQMSLDKASISKNSYNRRPSNLDSNARNEAMNPHLQKSVSDAAVETHISYNRKETVFNPDITVTRRKETSNSLDSSFSSKKERVYSAMDKSQKQQVHPEPKDIHEVPANNNGKLHYDHSKNGNNVASYVKPTWAQNRTRKSEGLASNMPPIRQEGPGLIGIEKEVDTTPAYTILKGVRNGGGRVDNATMYDDFTKVDKAKNPIHDEFFKVEKESKLPKPKYDEFLPREGKTHMYDDFTKNKKAENLIYDEYGKIEKDRKLPYGSFLKTDQERKPKYDELPREEKTHLYDDFTKMEKAGNPIYDEFMTAEKEKRYDASLFERSSRNTTPRPLSMIPPPYTKSNVKGTPNYIPKPPICVDKLGTLERQENEVKQGRKKHHEGRRRHELYDGDCDEEDEIMDRLLKHLSKKGYEEESSRRKSRARAPNAERVSSPPNESVSPVVGGGGHCRASSMQTDVRVSDYDDLAARFQALKRN